MYRVLYDQTVTNEKSVVDNPNRRNQWRIANSSCPVSRRRAADLEEAAGTGAGVVAMPVSAKAKAEGMEMGLVPLRGCRWIRSRGSV